MNLETFWLTDFTAKVTDTVKTAVFYRVIAPSIKSSNIELSVLRMKVSAHYSGQKISLERNDCALGTDACSVAKDKVMGA